MILRKSDRVILCRHKDYRHLNIEINFSELWEGAPNQKQGQGKTNWGGGFRGRPHLADQLMPTLQIIAHNDKPPVLRSRLTSFRTFFRFLDRYEIWAGAQGGKVCPVAIDQLGAMTTHHLQLWKSVSPSGEWQQTGWDHYRSVTQCLREAVTRLGLPQLIVPSYSRHRPDDPRDFPDEAAGKLLVKALAKEAIAVFEHWERSDRLARAGRNLMGVERTPSASNNAKTKTINREGGVSEADLHATYRAAVAANLDLPLDRIELLAIFGYGDGVNDRGTPSWWPRYQDGPRAGKQVRFIDVQSGLYPTAEQVAILFLLFLARTGWNPATADSLDIANEVNWCKEYTKKFVWLFGYKLRSQDWQDTVAIKNHRTGAYQIVKRLLARTEVLRRAIDRDPSLCTNSKIAKRSPWLYIRTNQNDAIPVRVEINKSRQNDVLRQVIAAHNMRQESAERRIPTTLSAGDLRDIFAGATFTNSNLSLFLTQLALGHKSSVTTFSYLRRRAWRAESEHKKNAMFVALIDQLETHRVINLTLLRAQMDGITVTQAQIDRLDAYRRYRTYSGTGCSDPTYPPAYIDPANPRDGTTRCVQGHLCAGCPKARVFNDSLPLLARRCAELEWLRDTLPLEVFQDSSLADQFLVIRSTLKQWPTDEVTHHVAHWSAQIISGMHRPIRFSGEH